ncbi:LysR family transcriptional regulator [Bacillus sp. NP157]|nr:LysR family transcriptional regulator [Bacillus sp. NP157]
MDLIAALKSFVRVAQTGSFSAVASERGLTQPAISRQVSALEAHLGTRLVQRSTQAVTLTDEGRELLDRAQRLIDDAESLPFSIGAQRGKPTGRVRIALPVPLGLYLSSHLGPFLARHPGLSLDLVLRDGASNLIEEGLDCEIRLGPLDDSTMVARSIGMTKAYLVAAPAYLDAHPPLQHPHDLARHACLFYQRWGRDRTWWFGDARKGGGAAGDEIAVPIHGRIHSNNAGAVHRAVLAGQGIAVLSHLLVADDLAAGRLRHVLPDFPTRRFPIHVLYPSSRGLPPRTRVLIDYIAELLGNDPEMAPASGSFLDVPHT